MIFTLQVEAIPKVAPCSWIQLHDVQVTKCFTKSVTWLVKTCFTLSLQIESCWQSKMVTSSSLSALSPGHIQFIRYLKKQLVPAGATPSLLIPSVCTNSDISSHCALPFATSVDLWESCLERSQFLSLTLTVVRE